MTLISSCLLWVFSRFCAYKKQNKHDDWFVQLVEDWEGRALYVHKLSVFVLKNKLYINNDHIFTKNKNKEVVKLSKAKNITPKLFIQFLQKKNAQAFFSLYYQNHIKKNNNGVNGVSLLRIDFLPSKGRNEWQVSTDRHEATVHSKQKIVLGTRNVKTLNQCGHLENIKQEMNRLNVNILNMWNEIEKHWSFCQWQTRLYVQAERKTEGE